MRFAVLAVALTLGGCVTQAEREARFAEADDQKCQSFGAKPGSDSYVQCRVQMSNQRTTLRAAAIGAGPTTCVRSGNITNCN